MSGIVSGNRGPTALVILDGWGFSRDREANAVAIARTPVFDRHFADCPHAFLRTDGENVGLPDGQFGNSEVGHLNLGAGRIVMQELPRISRACADGSLAASDVMAELIRRVRGGSGRLHLLGLLSPGGVHSHQDHLVALVRILTDAGIEVLVHAFLDGRDTAPKGGAKFARKFLGDLDGVKGWRIATFAGRYHAMDRDNRFERTQKAYRAIVDADAPASPDLQGGIAQAYEAGTGDEFVEPHVIEGYGGAMAGDAFLCANFRADRVRQIMRALALPDFDGFERREPEWSAIAGMTHYSDDLAPHMLTLFAPLGMSNILGDVLADHGCRQLRAAETEKYPHVTFFFNGGVETPKKGEQRLLVASPKVATYDLQPEMSAPELTRRILEALEDPSPDFVLVNFANPDMVGHTGVLQAAVRAVETVDECLGRLLERILELGGTAFVTADHGNCEQMIDPQTGGPHTAHTTNPVPCFLAGASPGTGLRQGILADVAPTILELMGIEQPAEMTGNSLLTRA
ncbi:MAG: 2,3-bisphosphoglycerate-independent phosphoglycerate mutase [Geminicoccaceae bacterium]